MLFAMREGSLTLWYRVRSPQILKAFRGGYLFSDGFCSAQGRDCPHGKPRATAHVSQNSHLYGNRSGFV